jgi:hypothetical protein
MVENVEPTGLAATVAGRRGAASIASRPRPGRVHLSVKVVSAEGRVIVVVTLGRGPGALGLEFYEPRGVDGVIQDESDSCVPWIACRRRKRVEGEGGRRSRRELRTSICRERRGALAQQAPSWPELRHS